VFEFSSIALALSFLPFTVPAIWIGQIYLFDFFIVPGLPVMAGFTMLTGIISYCIAKFIYKSCELSQLSNELSIKSSQELSDQESDQESEVSFYSVDASDEIFYDASVKF
jgi:hypothetical protein